MPISIPLRIAPKAVTESGWYLVRHNKTDSYSEEALFLVAGNAVPADFKWIAGPIHATHFNHLKEA